MPFADSEFGKIFLANTRAGLAQAAIEQEQLRAAQFANLARGYTGDVLQEGEHGVVRPSRPIDQNFALQAAAIPGYQQYAAQILNQQQAQKGNMDLQRQGQEWAQGNETLHQVNTRAENARQFGTLSPYQQGMLGLQRQQQAQQQQQWGSISPYQQAMLGLQEREQTSREQLARPTGTGGALPGSPLYDTQLQDLTQVTEGIDATLKLGTLWGKAGKLPGMFGREEMAAAEPYKLQVMGAMAKILGSGKVDEGERKMFESALREPDFWSSSKNTQAVLDGLKVALQKRQKAMLERNPNLPRPAAPEGFK